MDTNKLTDTPNMYICISQIGRSNGPRFRCSILNHFKLTNRYFLQKWEFKKRCNKVNIIVSTSSL